MTQQQQGASSGQPAEQKKRGIFSQVSMPAILAAVLASITSFLFSSRLGLTGSLIGAALATAVSTIAAQLYNGMIRTSVDAISEISDQVQSMVEKRQDTVEIAPLERTQVRATPVEVSELEPQEAVAQTGTPVAPPAYRDEADRRKVKAFKQRSFAIATALALATLLVYGVVVHVVTQGKGIGPTSIEEIATPQPAPQQDASSEQQASEATPAETPEKDSPADTGDEQTTDATAAAEQDAVTEPTTSTEGETASPDPNTTQEPTQPSDGGTTDATTPTDSGEGEGTSTPQPEAESSPAPSASSSKPATEG